MSNVVETIKKNAGIFKNRRLKPISSADKSSPARKVKRNKASEDGISSIFSSIGTFFKTLFGTYPIDNTPYEKLHKKLKSVSSSENYIKERAKYLFNKSNEVLTNANRQRARGKNPWEGIDDDNTGVHMSRILAMFQGHGEEQRYNYNLAVNYWQGVQLGLYDVDGTKSGRIISIDDHDNTWMNKNWDPSDTWLVASLEEMMWARKIFEQGETLNVSEWVNTARAPFSTILQLVPQGQEKNITYSVLDGPIRERYGIASKDRLEFAKRAAIVALNSSIIHKPNQPTQYSSKLLREVQFLKSEEGKELLKSLLSLIRKEGFSVFEPKGLPRYLTETQLATGESYLPNYLQIVDLKEHYVDKRKSNVSKKDAWQQFGEKVKRNVDAGIPYWQRIDKIKNELAREIKVLKSQNFSEQEIEANENIIRIRKELEEVRKKAYDYIRLPGADKPAESDHIDFYKLLQENPYAFYKKVPEGVLTSPTIHFYDNHGTPIKGAINKITNIFEKSSADVNVRRQVAALNTESFNGNGLHGDIVRFRNKGIEKLIDEGQEGYLRWKMCKYLEERFTADQLKDLKLKSGGKIFDCRESGLLFSEEFIKESKDASVQELESYKTFLKENFTGLDPRISALSEIVESFLPEGESINRFRAGFIWKYSCFNADFERVSQINRKLETSNSEKLSEKLEAEKRELLSRLGNEIGDLIQKDIKENNDNSSLCFYPNELFTVNNTIAYTNDYAYNAILNLVIKRNLNPKKGAIDPEGQYYVEVQPAREKHLGVPDFEEVLKRKLFLHVAGDSKSDICMMASALERGGAASVVFNLVQNKAIYEEILKQRRAYLKDFEETKESRNLFNQCVDAFGIYALEHVGDGGYSKVIGFNSQGKKIYETSGNGQAKVFRHEDLLKEVKEQYQNKIFRFRCPEAYVRARAEIFGLQTGENIELDYEKLHEAKRLYSLQKKGIKLSREEKDILKEYEWAVIAEKQGKALPSEATHYNVFREWAGTDSRGKFIVYRSTSHNGELVINRCNGSKVNIFKGGEEALKKLEEREIFLNDKGKYAYLNDKQIEVLYSNPKRLSDYTVEHKLFDRPTKFTSFFGESFIRNLPHMFNWLLKYSGGLMALGGLVRLLSPILGGQKDNVYRAGYWLSNGVRALSAFGGALRGVLNVHKAYNITFGEVINMVASFLPNGLKHGVLGLGNTVLFLGRGQQRALVEQRINNHTREEIEGKAEEGEFIDPRGYVRDVTRLSTHLISDVKQEIKKSGMSSLFGEIVGNMVSAVVTPFKMLKDIFKDFRLITSTDKRMSEKSGSYTSSIPSVGHLLTLTGLLSGVSAVTAAIFGRTEKFGEVSEDTGFNKVGSWAIALANMIPALGIIANAREVMSNKEGLRRIFKDVHGKDRMYNPIKAGLNQLLAGIGYAVVPMFGLENKYVASFFDIFTGQYFYGVSEEELPNTNILSRSILRRNQQLYSEADADYSMAA